MDMSLTHTDGHDECDWSEEALRPGLNWAGITDVNKNKDSLVMSFGARIRR